MSRGRGSGILNSLVMRPGRGDISKTRDDVKTWFDYLDLDDHITFGGKP